MITFLFYAPDKNFNVLKIVQNILPQNKCDT